MNKKEKTIFRDYSPIEGSPKIHGEGQSSVIPLGEKVKAAVVQSQALGEESGDERQDLESVAETPSGEGAENLDAENRMPTTPGGWMGSESFIQWTVDGTKALLGPFPRQDIYEAGESSIKAHDALQIISSSCDSEVYKSYSTRKLSRIAASHAIHVGQIVDYLSFVASSSAQKICDLEKEAKNKDKVFEKMKEELQETHAQFSTADEREKKLRAQLAEVQKIYVEKDELISSSRKEIDQEKKNVKTLRAKLEKLETTTKDQEIRINAVQPPEAIIELFRKSSDYANDMYVVCNEAFDAAKNFFIALNIVSEEKVSKYTYIDADKWILEVTKK